MTTDPTITTFKTTDPQQMARLVNTVAIDPHYEYLGMETKPAGYWGLRTLFTVRYRIRVKPVPPPKPLPKLNFNIGPIRDRSIPARPLLNINVGPIRERNIPAPPRLGLIVGPISNRL